jgi:aspartate-semialdehyde dehydrogenase
MKKTALVIGATGLVGNELVHQLLADDRFGAVLVFVRRSMGISHSKLQEFIINFDEPQNWSHLVKGDVLFSALGTTLKKAGSKEAQYKIDHDY